jgi:hypothetical protein
MTEAQWLACADPARMLTHLHGRGVNRRKMRLLAVACCRRIWTLLTEEASRRGVEVSERYADGGAGLDDLWEAYLAALYRVDADPGWHDPGRRRAEAAAAYAAYYAAVPNSASSYHHVVEYARQAAAHDPDGRPAGHAGPAEPAAQAELLRDVFGTPFRTPVTAPAWRQWNDGCVVRLAEAVYEGHRFGDLPVLADALEEAGCDNPDILSHCRSAGPHVRGCWVVDRLLAKT